MLVHGRARAPLLSNALACVVQLVTFDPCGAPALSLGTWLTDAQSGQCSAAAAASSAAADSTAARFITARIQSR